MASHEYDVRRLAGTKTPIWALSKLKQKPFPHWLTMRFFKEDERGANECLFRLCRRTVGLATIRATCKVYGATLDESCLDSQLKVDLPPGSVWNINGLHTRTRPFARPGRRQLDIRDLLEDMEHGVSSCPNPDCAVCNTVEEPTCQKNDR